LAGDAAHASCPHHGAGAGFGIEDALALATLLEAANSGPSKAKTVAALEVYNNVRYERTQWLMQSSRATGDFYTGRDPNVGRDFEKFGREIEWRSHKIWYYDVEGMAKGALANFRELVR